VIWILERAQINSIIGFFFQSSAKMGQARVRHRRVQVELTLRLQKLFAHVSYCPVERRRVLKIAGGQAMRATLASGRGSCLKFRVEKAGVRLDRGGANYRFPYNH